MPIDYSKAKIYKISSRSNPELIYIGSTVQPLCERFAGHNRECKHFMSHQDIGKRTTSFDIIELGDAYIELIELFACTCKEELTAREAHFIRTINCVNKVIPGRTQKEYREDNKELLAQKNKIHRDEIKDTPEFKQKKRESDAKYRQENLEKIREYGRTQERRDASNQRRRVKVICECGCELAVGNMADHKRSQKHINLMAQQQNK